ncbi:hypothetical protein V6574_01570 [Streptomyces sp. SM1P]
MIRELLRQADPTVVLPEPTGRAMDDLTAGPDARLAFSYRAKNANLVLAGTGKVTVIVDGRTTKTIDVSGSPTLYRLTDDKDPRTARLEPRLDERLEAHAFTFG